MVNVGQCGEQQILVTNLPQKIELKKMLKKNVLFLSETLWRLTSIKIKMPNLRRKDIPNGTLVRLTNLARPKGVATDT